MPDSLMHSWPLLGRDRELAIINSTYHSPDVAGVAIVGPAGVGKSRLAEEALRIAAASGRQCLRINASSAVRDLPLEALASLLPADFGSVVRPGAVTVEALRVLTETYGDQKPVLCVDDAHWLDALSAFVIHRAAAARLFTVVTTVRTGEAVPDDITALWKDRVLLRINLEPLHTITIEELVCETLAGTVATSTMHHITRMVGGNPLFLRELLLGAAEAGLLVREDMIWKLEGSPAAVPQLAELIDARLSDLMPAERNGMELIAVAGEFELLMLHEVLGTDTVESLERRSLIKVRPDGDLLTAHLAHPLYGELLRHSMPSTAHTRYNRLLADTVERSGLRRKGDLLRWAVWRSIGGGPVDPELMRASATQAMIQRADPVLRERLARDAWQVSADLSVGLILSLALFELGRGAEAIDFLGGLAERIDTEQARTEVAMAKSWYLGYFAGHVDVAVDIVSDARLGIDDELLLANLQAQHGTLLAYAAQPAGALLLLEPLTASPSGQVRARAGIGACMAYLLAGRFLDSESALDEANQPHSEAEDARAFAPTGGFEALRMRILSDSGRPTEACDIGQRALATAARSSDTRGVAWSAVGIASAELAVGRLDAARAHGVEAAAVFGASRSSWAEGWCLAISLIAAVQQGDRPVADRLAEQLNAVAPERFQPRLFQFEVDRARAWYASLQHGLGAARRLTRDCVRRWLAVGAVMPAVVATHDLLRFDDAREAIAELGGIDIPPGWRLGSAISDHVQAAAERNPGRIESASRAFAEMGYLLHAAEAAAQASAVWKGRNDKAAERARMYASVLSARCGGPRTPLLVALDRPSSLTRRELEVGELAARGHTNRDIAAALVLSERTVENHLNRAYTKLGISGRDELDAALRLSVALGTGQPKN